MQTIKIFGERNTGTHYLARLIADNCDAKLLPGVVPGFLASAPEHVKDLFFGLSFRWNLGWKHARVDGARLKAAPLAARVRYVALVKNPYSFLLSLYKNPYHFRGRPPASFEEFVQRRWFLRRRDNMTVESVASPTELWVEKTASYLRLAQEAAERLFVLRYEDLVTDPSQAIAGISARFGMKMSRSFSNLNRSAKGDGTGTFTDYRDYYLNEKWRARLTPEAVGVINQSLDAGLVEKLGYQLI